VEGEAEKKAEEAVEAVEEEAKKKAEEAAGTVKEEMKMDKPAGGSG